MNLGWIDKFSIIVFSFNTIWMRCDSSNWFSKDKLEMSFLCSFHFEDKQKSRLMGNLNKDLMIYHGKNFPFCDLMDFSRLWMVISQRRTPISWVICIRLNYLTWKKNYQQGQSWLISKLTLRMKVARSVSGWQFHWEVWNLIQLICPETRGSWVVCAVHFGSDNLCPI